jgi:hypothetical protein
MTNIDQARSYLASVLPWPQEGDEPAFVNLHWTFIPKSGDLKKDKTGKPIYPWAGRACRSVSEAVKALEFALANEGTRDIYACLSTQRTALEKVSGRGFKWNAPIRSQVNAGHLKSLFIDIDFKGGDHGYDTPTEAVTSLGKFISKVGLPNPSIIVSSGGGMHVYWTLAGALTPDEWMPLAYALAEATKREGLKCDTQCTIDSARVLRVPNTFNYKTDPKRPVNVVGQPTGFDYLVDRLATPLEPYKVSTPSAPASTRLDPTVFPRLAPIEDSDLAGGIDLISRAPIEFKSLLPECAFLKDALTSGGKDLTNPLWNLTTLISTFCDNGLTMAHLMGRQHPGYTKESTDELYERKSKDKEEKNLGWPSCATISATGCKSCQACPHFAERKSPLNFASKIGPPPPNQVTPLAPSATTIPNNQDVPSGYARRIDGVICRLDMDDSGATIQRPICGVPMIEPWLQKNPWELHFTTVTDTRQPIVIATESIGSTEMRKVLQSQGLMLHTDEVKAVTEFLVSWIEKLKQSKNAVVSTSPFGWNVKNGKVEGFVYGGCVWTPTGQRPAPVADPVTANQYTPTGELDPWMNAARLITSQGRPALDAILASAFAAPLVRFTGQAGLLMSVFSEGSGIGKTTAMKVAQAVWGDPVRAMQGLSDTQNSVLNKIGEIRSLPLYWDELKTEDDTKRFVNIVFQLTLGKEKSRMTSKVVQKQVGTWQTLLVSASNESLLDYVASRTRMTTAGLYRVFEYTVDPAVGEVGQIAPADAQRMISLLNDNYGQVGCAYAEFLGPNYARIDKEVGEYLKALEVETTAQRDERFWTGLVAVHLHGCPLCQ